MEKHINRPRKAVFSILIASALLGGCTLSNIHNDKSVAQVNSLSDAQLLVQPGMSMDQVRAKLGKPGFINTYNDTTMWTYQSRNTKLAGKKLIGFVATGYSPADTKMMTVHFDSTGIVEKVDFNQQSF